MTNSIDGYELSADELRQIFRLTHELCELGNDPVQWNMHLLQSLGRLIDAPYGLAAVLPLQFNPSSYQCTLTVHHCLDDVWIEYIDTADCSDNPETPGVMQRYGTDWTCTRRDLVDDATWYQSPFYERISQAAGTDDHILSQVCVQSQGQIHHLAAMRAPGAPYFNQREVAIVRSLHAELAHLWQKPESVEIDSLPKRLLETVAGMRRGSSRKTIANELGISAHTVHTYERQLFERFKVTSRGELLARLARAIRPTLPK